MSTDKKAPKKKPAPRKSAAGKNNVWDAATAIAGRALRAGNGAWPILCVTVVACWFAKILGPEGLKDVLLKLIDTGPTAGFGWLLAFVCSVAFLIQRHVDKSQIKRLVEERNRLQLESNASVRSSTDEQNLQIGVSKND